MANLISTRSAFFVSDGSYETGKASSAVIAGCPGSKTVSMMFGNKVFGPPKAMNSYRAELAGIFSSLTMIRLLVCHHSIVTGAATLALDGQSAIDKSSSKELDCRDPSFDLLCSIHHLIRQLKTQKIDISFQWVEGHQLDKHGRESKVGYFNRLADIAAKGLLTASLPIHQPSRLEGERWSILVDKVKQDNHDLQSLYSLTFSSTVSRSFWSRRFEWSQETFQSVCWETLARSQQLFSWGRRKVVSKLISGFAPTGRVMFRRRLWTHDECPRCFLPNEDMEHVLKCWAPSAQQARVQALESLNKSMAELDTHPQIMEAWMALLNGKPINWNWSPETQVLYRSQKQLGLVPSSSGFVVKGWKKLQEAWVLQQHTRWKWSESKWSSNFANVIKAFGLAMWDHRNEILHSPDHEWKLQEKIILQPQIDNLLQNLQQVQLQPNDTGLLLPIEHILNQDLDYCRQWMTSAKKAILRTQDSNQGQITSWLVTR